MINLNFCNGPFWRSNEKHNFQVAPQKQSVGDPKKKRKSVIHGANRHSSDNYTQRKSKDNMSKKGLHSNDRKLSIENKYLCSLMQKLTIWSVRHFVLASFILSMKLGLLAFSCVLDVDSSWISYWPSELTRRWSRHLLTKSYGADNHR